MIVGIDEVNFSPSLAGDCVVCALARKPGTRKIQGVKDSKQLTHEKRIELFERIQENSWYSIAIASVNDINSEGIYTARNVAIIHGINSICMKLWNINPELTGELKAIIDGPFSESWLTTFRHACRDTQIECLINGDEKIYEISAASCVGKVYADALFAGFGQFYPGYGFEHDHGSPSKNHIEALRKRGPSPYHRTKNYAAEWWKRILKEGTGNQSF